MTAVRSVAVPRAFPSPCRRMPLRVVAFAMALAAPGVPATEPSEPASDGSAKRADHAARLPELADSVSHHPVWQLALLERAYRGDANHTGAAQPLYARTWLAALLKLGLTGEAVSVYESVPESVRETTLAFEGTVRLISWLPGTDSTALRLEFAAACLLEGRPDLAKRVVAVAAELAASSPSNDRADVQDVVSPPSGSSNNEHWKPPDLDEHGNRLAMLRRKLEPSDADPFGLLVGASTSLSNAAWSQSVTWRRLFASLAEQEGYPSMARFHHRNAGLRLNARWWDPARVPEAAKEPEVIAAVSKATSAVNRLRISLETLERSALDPPPDDPASRLDETIRRLIAAPSILDPREQPLPDGITPVTPALTWEQERKHSIALQREYNLPTGYLIVRVERLGSSVVALGASRDYDPVAVSLSSHGAYWVLRSRDGGVNWDPPLYTGLRMLMPYIAVHQSHLPMIGRSGLRLEVKIREGDPDSIFFPGGYTSYKRSEDGLFVELPWELLERDSDGDGLTDLAEERLLTDPLGADTDRDGLDDRNDPLPHVVHSDATDSRAALVRAILEESDGGPLATVDTFDEQTVFVVARRAHFRGVRPLRRTIVLSTEEQAASVVKFGTFFPMRIEPITINRDGNLAFSTWSGGWWGGNGIFEKVGKVWVSIGGYFWIS